MPSSQRSDSASLGRDVVREAPIRSVRPTISIRGLLGTSLMDSESGQALWGAALSRLVSPKSDQGLRTCAHPLGLGVPLSELRDGVDSGGPIRGFRYAFPVLEKVGRLLGRPSLSTLEPGESAVKGKRRSVFSYDWRREISEHAARLHEHVLERRSPDGADGGRVDIVGHSMGGLLLQYYLRYGPEPLPGDGSSPELTWRGAELVRNAVIMGTPARGSVAGVMTLARGAKLIPLVGHRYPAPLLGTIASVYQLFPRNEDGRVVVEGTGKPVDLYDVETWRRFRWGLFAEGYERFLEAVSDGETRQERLDAGAEHLEKCLARARQFHAAVDRPEPCPEGTRVHVMAGEAFPTAEALAVDPGSGRLRVSSKSAGDSIVTVDSAFGHSGRPDAMRDGYTTVERVPTTHRAMPGDVALMRRIGRLARGEHYAGRQG